MGGCGSTPTTYFSKIWTGFTTCNLTKMCRTRSVTIQTYSFSLFRPTRLQKEGKSEEQKFRYSLDTKTG